MECRSIVFVNAFITSDTNENPTVELRFVYNLLGTSLKTEVATTIEYLLR